MPNLKNDLVEGSSEILFQDCKTKQWMDLVLMFLLLKAQGLKEKYKNIKMRSTVFSFV